MVCLQNHPSPAKENSKRFWIALIHSTTASWEKGLLTWFLSKEYLQVCIPAFVGKQPKRLREIYFITELKAIRFSRRKKPRDRKIVLFRWRNLDPKTVGGLPTSPSKLVQVILRRVLWGGLLPKVTPRRNWELIKNHSGLVIKNRTSLGFLTFNPMIQENQHYHHQEKRAWGRKGG